MRSLSGLWWCGWCTCVLAPDHCACVQLCGKRLRSDAACGSKLLSNPLCVFLPLCVYICFLHAGLPSTGTTLTSRSSCSSGQQRQAGPGRAPSTCQIGRPTLVCACATGRWLGRSVFAAAFEFADCLLFDGFMGSMQRQLRGGCAAALLSTLCTKS